MDVLSGGEKQRMAVSSLLLLNSLSVLSRYPSNLIHCTGWQMRRNFFYQLQRIPASQTFITVGTLVKGKN